MLTLYTAIRDMGPLNRTSVLWGLRSQHYIIIIIIINM